METRKLYYEDCHCREFTAKVVSCQPEENGYAVILDATAFFPEGGGQACDLGTLGDARVLDVQEKDNGVWHLCDRALTVGSEVHGLVDWDRRFDLMQQHTGEHIVSGIIHKMFGCHNVGFHVGAEVITIDFDALIPQEALKQIEQEANRAIFANLPVICRYPDQSELASLPYRTKKQLPWPVRIVEIPGYDRCACCGVHVKQTGEVGIIKLLSCVKFHQGVRIEMVCGGRALELFSQIYEQNRLVSQCFSAKLMETGVAAQRMNEALAAEKFRSTGLQRQLFDAIAAACEESGETVQFTQNLLSGEVRELADRIAKACGGSAAVFSGSDREGYCICLIGPAEKVSSLGSQLKQQLQARGGGKPGFFQGSVQAPKAQIRQILAESW